MKIYLKNKCDRTGLKIELPKTATVNSTGYDILAISEPVIMGDVVNFPMDSLKLYRRIDYIQYHTGIYIAPETSDEYVEIFPRSSISNKNLVLANGIGLIDSDYRGEILLRFKYIAAAEDLFIVPEAGVTRIYYKINQEKIFQQGEKIGQLVARHKLNIEFVLTESLPITARASGGFGSSGK